MANTKRVYIQDGENYAVSADLQVNEIKSQLAGLLGMPWITQATVCTRDNGDLEFKRPPAAPKG